MAHWVDQYIGLPYDPIYLDCGRIPSKVRHEIFGLDDKRLDFDRLTCRTSRHKLLTGFMSSVFERTTDPQEGDNVVMLCNGRASHIGVYCIVDHHEQVLHAYKPAGMVVLTRLSDLHKLLLELEGFYKWK
jgi:hypothetical protein